MNFVISFSFTMRSVWWLCLVKVGIAVLPFRQPDACERNMCVAKATYCLLHLPGVYRYLGPACASGSTCTACVVLPDSGILECSCETPPSTFPAQHGEPCNMVTECEQESCWRQCDTFYYSSVCPTDRCVWDNWTSTCSDIRDKPNAPVWNLLAPYGSLNPPEFLRGQFIVNGTRNESFPLNFDNLRSASSGYLIAGYVPIGTLVSLEELFLMLDTDVDAELTGGEFASLPSVLSELESRLDLPVVPIGNTTNNTVTGRRLVSGDGNMTKGLEDAVVEVDPGILCQLDSKLYCAANDDCVSNCTECAWMNTPSFWTYRCGPASVSSCKVLGKLFCSNSSSCVDDCSSDCFFTFPDFVSNTCRNDWWTQTVPSTNSSDWICRSQKSVGQTCLSDLDCVYGNRTCVVADGSGVCAPVAGECRSDSDCDPVNTYCASNEALNSTESLNSTAPPVNVCQSRKSVGDVCESDRECGSLALCNLVESPAVCREYFSLGFGTKSLSGLLCQTGSLDVFGACTKQSVVSRRLAQSCVTDSDCVTTDASGVTGVCGNKNWWESSTDACKVCKPIFGDYARNGETWKNWIWQKEKECGNQWTDEECVKEKGTVVSPYYYAWMCETQNLGGGIYVPSSSVCVDTQTVDYCAKLASVQNLIKTTRNFVMTESDMKGFVSAFTTIMSRDEKEDGINSLAVKAAVKQSASAGSELKKHKEVIWPYHNKNPVCNGDEESVEGKFAITAKRGVVKLFKAVAMHRRKVSAAGPPSGRDGRKQRRGLPRPIIAS